MLDMQDFDSITIPCGCTEAEGVVAGRIEEGLARLASAGDLILREGADERDSSVEEHLRELDALQTEMVRHATP